LISFDKFDRGDVQSGLSAVAAARGEKTADTQCRSGSRGLQPLRRLTDGQCLDVAFDLPRAAGFDLLRAVRDQAFDHRHAGRGVTQGFPLDQRAGQLEAIQCGDSANPDTQAAGAAGDSLGAASRVSSIDFDFSSFIIGEGVVTARLVRMIRWRRIASLNLKP